MPDCESDTNRAAGITSRGLNPDIFKRTFAQDAAIGNAIKGDTSSHAKTLHVCLFVNMADHLEHDFFSNSLDAARQIHITLGYLCFRLARSAFEETIESPVSHSQALRVAEVLVVHAKAAVFANLGEVIFNQRDVFRLAVWRQAHHFVFAAVDFESGVVSERAVE